MTERAQPGFYAESGFFVCQEKSLVDHSFDALGYVELEERLDSDRDFYAMDPAVAYPAILEHIDFLIRNRRRPLPTPIHDEDGSVIDLQPNPLEPLYIRAKQLPATVWIDTADGRLAVGDPLRAEALELARLWFTEVLHRQLGGGAMGLHILSDPAWRL